MIGLVVVGTLWMAQAVQPSRHGVTSLMVAQAATPADGAASAPATTTR